MLLIAPITGERHFTDMSRSLNHRIRESRATLIVGVLLALLTGGSGAMATLHGCLEPGAPQDMVGHHADSPGDHGQPADSECHCIGAACSPSSVLAGAPPRFSFSMGFIELPVPYTAPADIARTPLAYVLPFATAPPPSAIL